VIRLKQVEHVRNERNTLAAVAGHPFITTLVASFQDYDSLYMLVRIQFPGILYDMYTDSCAA
jgi:protein kinase A